MLSSANSSVRRAAITSSSVVVAKRQLSMACAQSVHKLQHLLEEYRVKNYSQEFPKRFQKDVVKAASAYTGSGNESASFLLPNSASVSAEGIENVLRNIGMGNRMTRMEIEGIFSEVGACPIRSEYNGSSSNGRSSTCVISADQMLQLLSKTIC